MNTNYLSDEICVVITNFDFSKNADYLKSIFSKFYKTIIIDSSSPNPPINIDISITNKYYPGLWNSALEYVNNYNFKWIMFIASDITIDCIDDLCLYANQASLLDQIGIYSPSLTHNSRSAYSNLFNNDTKSIREVGVIEGFFFLARTNILKKIYPIPENNNYGWGVDVLSSYLSYRDNLVVVVDDRIQIYHPASLPNHSINQNKAKIETIDYLGEEILNWSNNITTELSKNFKILSTDSSLDLYCKKNIANPLNLKLLYGVDINDQQSKNIKIADLNLEPIAFPNNYFDCVSSYDFIESVPKILYCPCRRFPLIELMNEIYRVLRPGGFFISNNSLVSIMKGLENPVYYNYISNQSFLYYFCKPNLSASKYGFTGSFKFLGDPTIDTKTIMIAN